MIETNLARQLARKAGLLAQLNPANGYLVFFNVEGREVGRTLVDDTAGYLLVSRHAVERILGAQA